MNSIFVNSENSKTSDPSRLLINLSVKRNWKQMWYVALSDLSIYYI